MAPMTTGGPWNLQTLPALEHSHHIFRSWNRFVTDTHKCLSSFADFLKKNGVAANSLFPVPSSFERGNDIRIDKKTYTALNDYIVSR